MTHQDAPALPVATPGQLRAARAATVLVDVVGVATLFVGIRVVRIGCTFPLRHGVTALAVYTRTADTRDGDRALADVLRAVHVGAWSILAPPLVGRMRAFAIARWRTVAG